MKKLKCLFLMLMLLTIVACQKASKTEVISDLTEQKTEPVKDAAVDSVGTGISNVDTVDNDLNTDDLGELDSGLADIESI